MWSGIVTLVDKNNRKGNNNIYVAIPADRNINDKDFETVTRPENRDSETTVYRM
jgi:DNA-binding cell septation regulator SpoVG